MPDESRRSTMTRRNPASLSHLWEPSGPSLQFSRSGVETMLGRRVGVWPANRLALDPVTQESDLALLRDGVEQAGDPSPSWLASGRLRGSSGRAERVVGRVRFAAEVDEPCAALGFSRRILGLGHDGHADRLTLDLEVDIHGLYVAPWLRRRAIGHVLGGAIAHTAVSDVRSLLSNLRDDPRPVDLCVSLEGESTGPAADRVVRQLREILLRGLELIESSVHAGVRRLALSVADFEFSDVPSLEATQPDTVLLR
jgi:hypothetical protein